MRQKVNRGLDFAARPAEAVCPERGVTMKILLAVDGSPCSALAADEVARLPWPAGSILKIVSVVEPFAPPMSEPVVLPQSYFDELDEAVRANARDAIEGALAKLSGRGGEALKVETEILRGSAARAILDEAEGWGADLVVVGSHGYGRAKRFLLGSVSQAVASHAKCSVQIVRCREAGGES